jgi:hypothetical protein
MAMKDDRTGAHEGGCTCGAVRYRLKSKPLFVHCCHCTWCQRETGSAFAINALIEAEHVELSSGELVVVSLPSNSGKGQKISRCPVCSIAVWSSYSGMGDEVLFVRVGTLDRPQLVPPDIHIFTESRLPWVELAPGPPVVPRYYRATEQWPPDSLARLDQLQRRVAR